jgi:branched-chain amino acid transport system permease protein
MLGWITQHEATLLDGLTQGMLLYLVAAGLTVIFGILKVLNLAHGAVFALGAYLAWKIAPDGRGLLLGLVIILAASFAIAGISQAAFRPLEKKGFLAQALVTLGISYVIAAAVGQVWGYNYESVKPPPEFDGSVSIGSAVFPSYYLVVIGIGVAVALALWLILVRTPLGLRLRASVDDREMAAATGVRVPRVRFAALFLGSLLALVGGWAAAPVLGVNPDLGSQEFVYALVIVVVGGLGSLRGAFLAALLIGEVQVVLTSVLPSAAAFVVFGTMAAILLIRPTGLFGTNVSVR